LLARAGLLAGEPKDSPHAELSLRCPAAAGGKPSLMGALGAGAGPSKAGGGRRRKSEGEQLMSAVLGMVRGFCC
jgi:hypothetical protein